MICRTRLNGSLTRGKLNSSQRISTLFFILPLFHPQFSECLFAPDRCRQACKGRRCIAANLRVITFELASGVINDHCTSTSHQTDGRKDNILSHNACRRISMARVKKTVLFKSDVQRAMVTSHSQTRSRCNEAGTPLTLLSVYSADKIRRCSTTQLE